METQQIILYETLTPIGPTAADSTPPPSESDSYIVLRNQISLSADGCPLPESAAPDYFSLDVNETENTETSPLAIPLPKTEPPEASTPAAERTLEGSWFRANCRFKSPMLRLHKEILDFCDFLSPTPEELESRNAAIESVFDVIKYIWPNAETEVFGSFKTGLYLPSSDIDLVILNSNVRNPQMGLQALSRGLSQRKIAKKIQVIAKARVPIIKFVEKKSAIPFDISFDVENGPKAAEYIKDAVSEWPPLRPLCLILKVFLQQRELNEVFTGGIGSYALLSMLIAMLRIRHDRQASPEHNLGVLLVNFFDMYGRKLNTVDVGVSCNGGGVFFSKNNKGFSIEGRPSLISIEDPQAPDNDIGKNSFNYYQAKSAFSNAFTRLTNSKVITQLGPNKSILGAIIRPDSVLLERKGGPTGNLTFNNLFPEAAEPVHQLLGNNSEVKKSSGKKRKASKESKTVKVAKVKARRTLEVDRPENGSVKESGVKSRRWGHRQSSGGGSSSSR